MRSSLLLTLLQCVFTITSVNASAPKFSLHLQDGTYGGIEALDPTVTWSGSAKMNKVSIAYGTVVRILPTHHISSLAKGMWTKISSEVCGLGIALKAKVNGVDFSNISLDMGVENKRLHAALYADATITSKESSSLDAVQVIKDFYFGGGVISVNPLFNMKTKEIDVKTFYSDKNGLDVEVKASKDFQSVTVSSLIDDTNRIAPTITSKGHISIDYERMLIGGNSILTTYKPNNSINVLLKEGPYKVNVFLPLDTALTVSGAQISIKRDLSF
jgi:hypothetical protein